MCSLIKYTGWCIHQIPIPWKYFLYFTKFCWIIIWYDYWKFSVNWLIWVGMIWIDVNIIDVNQNIRIFGPNFSTSKLFSLPAFLKMLSPSGFSILIFYNPCHDALLLEKSDVPLSKRAKLLMFLGEIPSSLFHPNPIICISVPLFRLVICGIMLPMVLYGFTPMPSFLFCPKSILTFLQLFIFPKEMSLSPFPRLSMEALAWLV